jgi:hypothetical protein
VTNFVFSRAIHQKIYRNFVLTDQTIPEVKKPEATIQQLNLGYNAQQDRLLLRVGLSDDTELVLWLTYRIAKQMWQQLNGETYLPAADSIQRDALPAEAVAQFKQEVQTTETLSKMDFATKYQPRKEIRNDSALLAIQLKLSGDVIKHLDIECLEGVTVGINLPPALVLALCNMLQLSSRESGWNIGAKVMPQPLLNAEEIASEITDKNKVLH